jgi:uncharacterized membrane protein YeaQ/YmgE (transglycosylase-associated protein family)
LLAAIGAVAFGLVIGWVTYRTLRRNSDAVSLSDIATVIGAVGGAAVTTLFQDDTTMFAWYSIGLAIGFFGYFVVGVLAKDNAPDWMLDP